MNIQYLLVYTKNIASFLVYSKCILYFSIHLQYLRLLLIFNCVYIVRMLSAWHQVLGPELKCVDEFLHTHTHSQTHTLVYMMHTCRSICMCRENFGGELPSHVVTRLHARPASLPHNLHLHLQLLLATSCQDDSAGSHLWHNEMPF